MSDEVRGPGWREARLWRALMEVGVIVAGIVIALAADAWWEEREYERLALTQLSSEFEANAAQLDTMLDAHRRTDEAMRILISASPGDAALSEDSLRTLFNRMDQWWMFSPRSGAIQSLVTGGGLRKITNDSLRVELAGWPGLVADYQEDEVRAIDFANGYQATFLIDAGLYAELSFTEDRGEPLRDALSLPNFRDVAAYRQAFFPNLLSEGASVSATLERIQRMI